MHEKEQKINILENLEENNGGKIFYEETGKTWSFETNSSSVHSLTMCSEEQYKKWENGEVLYWEDKDKFGTREEIIEEMKAMKWYNGTPRYAADTNWEDENVIDDIFFDEGIKSCDKYFENDWYETYERKYTTPNGETVVAFGYYGHD